MPRRREFGWAALFGCLTLSAQTTAPIRLEATTGLGPAAAMASDASGAIYIAGPVANSFGQSTLVRMPPGGPFFYSPDPNQTRSYIARVRPEGDVTFFVLLVPMTVQDLKLDSQGRLWAAGIATRSQPGDDVVPCYSVDNPTIDPDRTANAAPAVLQININSASVPIFQCVGRGWANGANDGLSARIALDNSGGIYLAGSATGYQGFTPTAGAPLPTPTTLSAVPSPWAIKLDSTATAIQYATWLPGDRVSAILADRSGNLTIGGATSESRPAPASSGAAQPTAGGGTILRTQDRGGSWRAASAGLPGAPDKVAIARRNTNALAAWSLGWISLSSDGGQSWLDPGTPGDASSDIRARTVAIDDSGSVVYLHQVDLFGQAALYRYDGSWSHVDVPAPLNLAAATLATGARTTVYLFQGGIWYSPDGGASWSMDAPDGSPFAMAPHPADGRIVWRMVPGPAYQTTTDFGVNWNSFNTPAPMVAPSAVSVNLLIAATSLNLYRSIDGGLHWQSYINLPCTGPQINPADSNSVLCISRFTATKIDLPSHQITPYQSVLGAGPINALLVSAVSTSQFYLLRNARTDGLLCQLNSGGTQFNFCSFLGGFGDDSISAIAAATGGGFWAAGTTTSRNFPVTSNAIQKTIRFPTDDTGFTVVESRDAFLCRFSADGKRTQACTLFGGSLNDIPVAVFEDSQGRPMLLGNTNSWDFPNTRDGLPSSYTSPPQFTFNLASSGFILRADAALTQALTASVFTSIPLGVAAAAGSDIAAYAGGDSSNAPADYLRLPYLDYISASIGVLDYSGALATNIAPYALREPVYYAGLSLTPGSMAILGGTGLATGTSTGTTDPLPRAIGNTQVLLDGGTAPLLYVSPNQVNFHVPWTASPGVHTLQVTRTGGRSAVVPLWLFPAVPIQFRNGTTPYPWAINENGTALDAAHPAPPGSLLTVLFSGAGNVYNAPAPGQKARSQGPSTLPARVFVGSYEADVWYTGVAPGMLGISEVQFRVPDLPAGEYSLWVMMDVVSSNRTTIPVGK